MGLSVAEKIIADHLVDGEMRPGAPIGLRIDQTLTQDATGTLVMLELEAMGLDRVKTELSAQYVDHNLVQEDHKNPDDHLFLKSACERFGIWYSRPGNGVSHPVHQERFGKPGRTMSGSDSHTPAAGAIGMIAIGAGGLDVALAMAGEPLRIKMPRIWGVELVGELPDWVSAKDVILELLRRHGVDGGVGRIIEYHGSGLASLSCMDRHVIANMGAELGATTTVFPSDGEVRRFLQRQGREDDWSELVADDGADYDERDRIDLSGLQPLIALPTSPGNVVPVREVAGQPIAQAYVGSSANPGYRDFAVAAEICRRSRRPTDVGVSFDINPTSRQILANLTRDGHLLSLVRAGARIHQAGCNGCIGMGQAPATDAISVRTVPRNFPGRSGTREDRVHLCSPETATASALTGVITDPRDLEDLFGMEYPRVVEPDDLIIDTDMLVAPLPPQRARQTALRKGPNIASLPDMDELPDELEVPVLLKVGDDVSTDEILPAGTRVLPYRSNIPEISRFAFDMIDPTYHDRAQAQRESGGHAVVGGKNYGQGSSREHAALAPRYLGLRLVIAKDYARIHWQNLINFGVLPLTFADETAYQDIDQGHVLRVSGIRDAIQDASELQVENATAGTTFTARHQLSERQVEVILRGGIIPWMKQRLGPGATADIAVDEVRPGR
ncbi:MAG TPA: aconitate hydratase [Nitriliruptorales bacterium]|nr:aconitate hydratase [Nitriliruptorales bacterium]